MTKRYPQALLPYLYYLKGSNENEKTDFFTVTVCAGFFPDGCKSFENQRFNNGYEVFSEASSKRQF